MEESQLLRGILEGCVLAVISQNETYGYEILSNLEKEGFDMLMEGTLYPVLTRLKKRDLSPAARQSLPMGQYVN